MVTLPVAHAEERPHPQNIGSRHINKLRCVKFSNLLPISNRRKNINDIYIPVVPTIFLFLSGSRRADRAHPPKKMIFPFLLSYYFELI